MFSNKDKLKKIKRDAEKDILKKQQEQLFAEPPISSKTPKKISPNFKFAIFSPSKIDSPQKVKDNKQPNSKRRLFEDNATISPEAPDKPSPITSSNKREIPVSEVNIEKVSMEDFQQVFFLPPPANEMMKHSEEPYTFPITNMTNQKRDDKETDDFHCTKKRKKEIGDWGEALVYRKLKQCDPQAETVWHNEAGEQGKPYDISLLAPGTQKEKYYEVKSTVASMKNMQNKASFSRHQVEKMEEEKDNYIIARVYKAETSHPSIALINDPYQKIFHPIRKEDEKVQTFKPIFPIVGLKLKI